MRLAMPLECVIASLGLISGAPVIVRSCSDDHQDGGAVPSSTAAADGGVVKGRVLGGRSWECNLQWYNDNADNSPSLKALAEARHRATREYWRY